MVLAGRTVGLVGGMVGMVWGLLVPGSLGTDGVLGARAAAGPRGRGRAGGGLAIVPRARGVVSHAPIHPPASIQHTRQAY